MIERWDWGGSNTSFSISIWTAYWPQPHPAHVILDNSVGITRTTGTCCSADLDTSVYLDLFVSWAAEDAELIWTSDCRTECWWSENFQLVWCRLNLRNISTDPNVTFLKLLLIDLIINWKILSIKWIYFSNINDSNYRRISRSENTDAINCILGIFNENTEKKKTTQHTGGWNEELVNERSL